MAVAETLHQTGRAHALSADLLYRAAVAHAEAEELPDPELFAFNGTYSLSIHYLIGLGLELCLKAAFVAHGGDEDVRFLRNEIGHDLVRALDLAEDRGFSSEAPHLREIVQHLRDPYIAHYFRYDRPEAFPLPDIIQVMQAFETLDNELAALLENAERTDL